MELVLAASILLIGVGLILNAIAVRRMIKLVLALNQVLMWLIVMRS
jgi:hypothetical protein